MKLLIGYLILINLAGFFSMCIDKRRARKGKYRISERWLFLIAAVGGSAGSLFGMYLFHHKTRHKRFVIGLPIILFLQIVILMVAASSFHAQAGRPSTSVRNTLDLVKQMDDETIHSFVSYEALSDQQLTEADEDAAFDAVRLFFERFDYEITDEQIAGDSAQVTVNISNLDAHSLAHDLCLQLTSQWIDLSKAPENAPVFTDYFALLRDSLKNNSYSIVQTSATFDLSLRQHKWILQMDEQVRDQIMGGLSSWLRNPYLLTPEEIITLYLDAFSALDADGWIRYFAADDLFATGSEEYAASIDRFFFEKLAEYYEWELVSCNTVDDQSEIQLSVESVDMKKVFTLYQEKLLSYAGTIESVTSGSTELSDTSARLLMESLEEASEKASFSATVTMGNDGVTWQPEDLSSLVNAMLGNLDDALEIMRS